MEYRFTKADFEKEVLQSKEPVFIDFYADWCGPCKMMAPVVEKLAEKYEGKVKVGKVNTDDEPELAQMFQVMSIPNMVIIKDGQVVDRIVGAVPQKELEAKLDAQLKKKEKGGGEGARWLWAGGGFFGMQSVERNHFEGK